MEFKRRLIRQNTSLYLNIPEELAAFYKWDEKTTVVIYPDEKKKGRFIAIWEDGK